MLRTGQRKDIYDFSSIQRNQAKLVARDNAAVPYLHPAYEAAIFVPLSFLPYRTAYITWTALNFVILALIYKLLRPCLSGLLALGPPWMPFGLLIGFLPVAVTVIEGRDSLLLLLALVLAYRRIGSNELQSGLPLSLGMFG